MLILVTNNGLGSVSLRDPVPRDTVSVRTDPVPQGSRGKGKADLEFSSHRDPLGQKMMGLFLRTLAALPEPPEKIVFYTEGVKLVAEDSPVVVELGELERRGTQIISCGTCLDYFGLTDRVVVGDIGGMGDIVRAILEADKVVTV